MEKSLQQAPRRTTNSEYFRRLWGVAAPGSKALATIDDNSLSRGVGWRQFVGPRCLLEKVGNSLGVWRARCSQPDGDQGSLDDCWRYLSEAPIRWDRSRHRSGSCGSGKKVLTRDQGLLVVFGPSPTSVGKVGSRPVSVQYIWLVSASVEEVDAPTEVLGGRQPCGCVGGR